MGGPSWTPRVYSVEECEAVAARVLNFGAPRTVVHGEGRRPVELVDFLRARYDEVAARAEAAPPGPWKVEVGGSIVDANGRRVIPSVGGAVDGRVSRWPEGPATEHIIDNDPARVLAEVEAKRALLDLHEPGETEYVDGDVCMACDVQGEEPFYPCKTLRLLARPFRDHPDFDSAWLEG